MPIDAGLHAQMTFLIQEEKRLKNKIEPLTDDIELWKQRVQLAERKGAGDLADQARERVRKLAGEAKELQGQLNTIAAEKKRLRRDSRRPDGHEVARAEALLESLRQSGIIDPEEAALEREFDELDAEQALAELRKDVDEASGEPE